MSYIEEQIEAYNESEFADNFFDWINDTSENLQEAFPPIIAGDDLKKGLDLITLGWVFTIIWLTGIRPRDIY